MSRAINETHYQEVYFNSSRYFNTCWIKDGADREMWENGNTSFVYSQTESIAVGIVVAVMSIAGTILNLPVIIALLRNKDLRNEYTTPTIVSIATTDLLHSAGSLPVASLHFFTGDMPLTTCDVYNFLGYGLWICSAWNLLGVSILRCVVVYFPEKTKNSHFLTISKLMPILCWILSFLYIMLGLFGKFGQFGLECQTFICRYFNIGEDGHPTDVNLENILYVQFVSIGIMIFLLNVSTCIRVSKQSRQIYRQVQHINEDMARNILEREKQVGKLLSIMSVLFFAVYGPSAVLHKIDPDYRITMPGPSIVCYLINWSYGIIDPLCYMIFQEKYRKAISDLFKPSCACTLSS